MNIDPTTVVITLFINIIGAFAIAYFTAKFHVSKTKADLKKEFESRFNEQKWQIYTSFADIIRQTLQSTKARRMNRDLPKITKKMNEFICQLLIIGSDDVVKALGEWLHYCRKAEEEDTAEEYATPLIKVATLLMEMRKDLGYETQLSPRDLLATFVTDIDEHL